MKLSLLLMIALLASCVNKDQIKKVIKENPDILTEAIEENPAEIMEALQKAAGKARETMAKRKEEQEKKKLEEYFEKPLKPKLSKDDVIRGTANAPLVLVEYSDFQCPYCTRGYQVVSELLEKYDGKITFIYKHLPLSFHTEAKIAAQYFEAIAIQSHKKAWEFHDVLFAKQAEIKKGEKFLMKVAKQVGANMRQLKKDVNSPKVMKIIAEHEAEAKKFGIQGTPGFVFNGIPVKGAYPTSHFEGIITKLQQKGKISL